MTMEECLFASRETGNAEFQAKLIPTLEKSVFLGVRVPKLRQIEKQFRSTEEADKFIESLPHAYYDENLLHSIFISNMGDYGKAMSRVSEFLPYVDNWAVCDTLIPKAFGKHKDKLIDEIKKWISSDEVYTCRFGVNMLMKFYLGDNFHAEYLSLPASVHTEEYYVNMVIALFYATALAKKWDETITYLDGRLDVWVHNKTIQKACESYRISDEKKAYLKTLKRG